MNLDNILVFLVGAFSFKEKSPTITVASFFLFFRQTTELIAYVPLFTETDKTTQVKSGQWKLSAKGPPFHFSPFLRNLQNRKRPKGPPFQFCFGTVRNFFRKIFKVSKESPLRVFLIFCNRMYVNESQRVPLFIFRHYATFSKFFFKKNFKKIFKFYFVPSRETVIFQSYRA